MKIAAAFAVLSLLLAPVTAAAECAWVLWQVPSTIDPTVPLTEVQHTYIPSRWSPLRGHPSSQACEEDRNKYELTELRDGMVKRNASGAKVFNTFLFRCLPDSVDPRGPKGSPR